MQTIAITREVSPNINDCELSFHARQPINVAQAIAEHRAYEDCLADLGVKVISLPPEPAYPDAVFVEDTAVVLDEIGVIANMGAQSRRGEVTSIAKALAPYRPLRFLTDPATLDGGDVLKIGRTLFVGVSRRTNQAGFNQLSKFLEPYAYRVLPVAVTGCLHLKSACCDIDNDTILINRRWINADQFCDFELLDVPKAEPAAANALSLHEVVIVPTAFPRTRTLLEKRGFRVRPLDVSELQKAEAGVTCCSLVFDQARASRGKSAVTEKNQHETE
jgi:dimethylargininase